MLPSTLNIKSRSSFETTPTIYDLGKVQLGIQYVAKVMIHNTGHLEERFRIRVQGRLEDKQSVVILQRPSGPLPSGLSAQVTVGVKVGAPSQLRAEVLIQGQDQSLTVPVRAEAEEPEWTPPTPHPPLLRPSSSN